MRSTPVIGITAYEEDARWGPWAERAALVPATYVHAVEGAGGAAALLPVQSPHLVTLLDRIDGLVLSGGPDVGAERYGEAAHAETQEPRVGRDDFELALVKEATRRAVPTLAVCRGMQVLNVARGGTLHQHLPEVVGHAGHSPMPGEFAWHRVEVAPHSRLAAILGTTQAEIASHHHQAVARLGGGLEVTARADDGTVEAVEDPSLPYLLGVQWHPEEGPDFALFGALVEAAAARPS
jgi:gamma-glutamyl-gamma-aminobutyrate hydrolase PuuD